MRFVFGGRMDRIANVLSSSLDEAERGLLVRAASADSMPKNDLKMLFQLRLIEPTELGTAPRLTPLGITVLSYMRHSTLDPSN